MDTKNIIAHSAPEDMGVPSKSIEQFISAVEEKGIELHSMMLLRHGRIIAEGWWAPYSAQLPHMLYSLSKSFTATAVGLAIEEGRFQLDDPILPFFAEEAPKKPEANLERMRVRDLLCMATGHAQEPMVFGEKNWEKAFLATAVPHAPGTYFLYNTAATYMLSSLVTRTTGENLTDYLMPRLFTPLGIPRPHWDESPNGASVGGIGLYLRTEDIARFGQMLLQNGRWNGQQLVPEHWIRLMTGWQIDSSPTQEKPEWSMGYGFQFWQCRGGAYRGDGLFGQFCLVLPQQDAVLALTSATTNTQGLLDAVFDTIVPAMGPRLSPDIPSGVSLIRRLDALQIAEPAQPQQARPAEALLGPNWEAPLPEGPFRIQLAQKPDRLVGSIQLSNPQPRARKPKHIKAPFGLQKGLMSTVNLMGKPQKAVGRAFGREDGGLLLILQLVETPYRYEIELGIQGGAPRMRMASHPQRASVNEAEWLPMTPVEEQPDA